jgi:hypothetical protein
VPLAQINADGSGPQAITHSRKGQLWFSGDYAPEGTEIAVMHYANGGLEVVDMAADGSDPAVFASCGTFGDHPGW